MSINLSKWLLAAVLLILPFLSMQVFTFAHAQSDKKAYSSDVRVENRPDFSGTWQLDLDVSDSMGEIMKAQGRSWAERKIAENMAVTQYITQASDKMMVVVESKVSKIVEDLRLDGVLETKTTEKMGTVQTRTYWDEGGALVTVIDMKLEDDEPAVMTMQRQLQDDGNTMVMFVSLKLKNGEILKAKRVLRKA